MHRPQFYSIELTQWSDKPMQSPDITSLLCFVKITTCYPNKPDKHAIPHVFIVINIFLHLSNQPGEGTNNLQEVL